MKPRSFEEAVSLYDRLIKGQIKKLRLYYDYDEYYQCGLIGLWKAYTKFDKDKGIFGAYAYYTIRGYLFAQMEKEKRYRRRHICWDPTIHIGSGEVRTDDFSQYLTILNEKERYVIAERIGQSRKLIDIAREQNLSYDQVRYMYANAIEKLRKEYRVRT